jgi:hypothetical protein
MKKPNNQIVENNFPFQFCSHLVVSSINSRFFYFIQEKLLENWWKFIFEYFENGYFQFEILDFWVLGNPCSNSSKFSFFNLFAIDFHLFQRFF